MPSRRRLGTEAEDRAAQFLQAKGMTLVTRRYKAADGEIDLVALDGETLVFVEVKLSRSRERKGEEAIDATKRARLFAAAEQYLASFGDTERPVRFDVVAIGPDGIRHIPEAFWP